LASIVIFWQGLVQWFYCEDYFDVAGFDARLRQLDVESKLLYLKINIIN
jgi:hypothetical protein